MFHDEIQRINTAFFQKYILELETRDFRVHKFTIRQGDSILTMSGNDVPDKMGTLGGFVTKTDKSNMKYALTCEHVISEKELAFSKMPDVKRIGKCVFTSKKDDFAAIKIKKSISEDCDITFRRDDYKKTNARVYEDNMKEIGDVYKIGNASNLTNGFIKSPELYYKCPEDNGNIHCVFLVRGRDDAFSRDGDSGSLVFSRPKGSTHSYVNVIGMVAGRAADDEKLSCCYPISPALKVFEESLELSVKFKDNLSPSESSSSSSSSSCSSLSPSSSPSTASTSF